MATKKKINDNVLTKEDISFAAAAVQAILNNSSKTTRLFRLGVDLSDPYMVEGCFEGVDLKDPVQVAHALGRMRGC